MPKAEDDGWRGGEKLHTNQFSPTMTCCDDQSRISEIRDIGDYDY